MNTKQLRTTYLHIIDAQQELRAPIDAKFISVKRKGGGVLLTYETSQAEDASGTTLYFFDCVPNKEYDPGTAQYIGEVKAEGIRWRYYVSTDPASTTFRAALTNNLPDMIAELDRKRKLVQHRAMVAVLVLTVAEFLLVAGVLLWFAVDK